MIVIVIVMGTGYSCGGSRERLGRMLRIGGGRGRIYNVAILLSNHGAREGWF